MLTVLSKIIVIFAMILTGFVAHRFKIIPIEVNKYLVDILILITTPCMIISSMNGNELNGGMFTHTLQTLLISASFFIITPLLCLLLKKALRHTKPEDIGVMTVIMTAVNTGFMGFPITYAIFGSYILFLMVIENITLNFYLYFISIIQMNSGLKTSPHKSIIIKAALNPCNFAALIGLILLFSGINLPGPAAEFFDTVGSATVPLSMIVVGVQLSTSNLRKVIQNRDLVYASLVNTVLIPALTFLAVNWLPIDNEVKLTIVFAASFPCAVATVPVASMAGKNTSLAAEGVGMTTAISMISLPVIATLLMAYYV